jgi:hypothetical protein
VVIYFRPYFSARFVVVVAFFRATRQLRRRDELEKL